MASFQAKIGWKRQKKRENKNCWKRPRKKENKYCRSVSFQPNA